MVKLRHLLIVSPSLCRLPFAAKTTFGVAWSVMAIIDVLLFTCILLLMWRGRYWREKLGSPNFDKDL